MTFFCWSGMVAHLSPKTVLSLQAVMLPLISSRSPASCEKLWSLSRPSFFARLLSLTTCVVSRISSTKARSGDLADRGRGRYDSQIVHGLEEAEALIEQVRDGDAPTVAFEFARTDETCRGPERPLEEDAPTQDLLRFWREKVWQVSCLTIPDFHKLIYLHLAGAPIARPAYPFMVRAV